MLLSHAVSYRLKHRETQSRFRLKRSSKCRAEIAIAFGTTSKNVAGLAIVLLVVAAFFGFLNSQKVKVLRAKAANAQAVRDGAEHRQAQEKQNDPSGVTAGTEQQSKLSEAENRASKAEAELAQAQKEKTDLQAKLDVNQQEIVSLQKRVEEAGKNANASIAGRSPAESAQTTALQSQLDDLRRQLDSAEKEKRSSPKRSRIARGVQANQKKRKNGAKLQALSEKQSVPIAQACMGPCSHIIRLTTSWC
jgi:predicted RNase H-like nuclease (RuvC/YqgF family)